MEAKQITPQDAPSLWLVPVIVEGQHCARREPVAVLAKTATEAQGRAHMRVEAQGLRVRLVLTPQRVERAVIGRTVVLFEEGVHFEFDFADRAGDGREWDCIDMRVGEISVGHLWDGRYPERLEALARVELAKRQHEEREQAGEDRAEERARARGVGAEVAA